MAESSLQLNFSITKEMCCGANNVQALCKPLKIVNGKEVEQAGSFKYLGTEIEFSFDKQSDNVFKKAYQHLGLLRKQEF